MKDSSDKKTLDAFPVKTRGRPVTGSAKSAAQRMAEKRERDRLVASAARYQSDYEVLSTSALLEAMADAVRNKFTADVRKISAILIKRSQEGG